MEWRCAWCGKPHEEDDPPCDSCGHGSFERAVVREPETIDAGPDFVWACQSCGREHVKYSPPCSRCGDPSLEKREATYENVSADLSVSSYAELSKPYLPIVAVFVVLAALVGTGVISIPTLAFGPSIPDAPGEGERAAGLDLADVEERVHERLEATRRDRGAASRTHDSGLDSLATYFNRDRVRTAHGEESVGDPDVGDFDLSCSRTITVYPATFRDAAALDAYEDESQLAEAIARHLRSQPRTERILFSSHSSEGVDVHVGPDGTVYVYYAVC